LYISTEDALEHLDLATEEMMNANPPPFLALFSIVISAHAHSFFTGKSPTKPTFLLLRLAALVKEDRVKRSLILAALTRLAPYYRLNPHMRKALLNLNWPADELKDQGSCLDQHVGYSEVQKRRCRRCHPLCPEDRPELGPYNFIKWCLWEPGVAG
jgi:hypothetical protein